MTVFFVDTLRQARKAAEAEEAAKAAADAEAKRLADIDPWIEKLKTLRGRINKLGRENVSARQAADHLGLSPYLRQRSWQRITRVMKQLGWEPLRIYEKDAPVIRGFGRAAIDQEMSPAMQG